MRRDPFLEIKEHIREREQWFAVGKKGSKAERARLDEWYSDLARMIANAVPKKLALTKKRRLWLWNLKAERFGRHLVRHGELLLMQPGRNMRAVGL